MGRKTVPAVAKHAFALRQRGSAVPALHAISAASPAPEAGK